MTGAFDGSALAIRRRGFGGVEALVVEWDFGVRGGTFGEREADDFVDACADAAATGTPLVTVLRSGGTRLQEGMRSLVGIPRAALALADLAEAGVPHLSVADQPTTGGVWVTIGSSADLRVAVSGATVGFSGPRVVAAMTGERIPPGANTAESALAAGLVDAVVPGEAVDTWLTTALRVLSPGPVEPMVPGPPALDPPDRRGWDQVVHSRERQRPGGGALLQAVIPERVELMGADATVAAAVGLLGGRPAVVVAAASERAGRVGPGGFRLLRRAADLAGRLGLPLVTLVDTAGADPLPGSEDAGVAPAIGEALLAVLRCPSPTVAVVHGEGGSGGALAAAVTDVVAVTETGWFAALAPEGAAAALRCSPQEAAETMRVAPAELLADGFADAVAPADPEALAAWLTATLRSSLAGDPGVRRQGRMRRWRGRLTGRLDDFGG